MFCEHVVRRNPTRRDERQCKELWMSAFRQRKIADPADCTRQRNVRERRTFCRNCNLLPNRSESVEFGCAVLRLVVSMARFVGIARAAALRSVTHSFRDDWHVPTDSTPRMWRIRRRPTYGNDLWHGLLLIRLLTVCPAAINTVDFRTQRTIDRHRFNSLGS